ncbi:hypothetical protein HDU88_004461 [Geranomyces variabilis]|nr:hypothetical protein HDU88_004461 [Geranomyces variabilis]
MLLAGETKPAGGERPLWQIIAYCGMLHKLRLKHVESSLYSHNATIYGFVTDSIVWEFVRIDYLHRSLHTKPFRRGSATSDDEDSEDSEAEDARMAAQLRERVAALDAERKKARGD